MKTRKIMFCLILAVCLIFCLIGCGLSTDINSVTDNTSEEISNDVSAEEVSSTVTSTKDPLLGSGTAGTKSIAANIYQLGTTSLDTVSFSSSNVYYTSYYGTFNQGNNLYSGTGSFGSYGSTERIGTTINSASINLCFTGTAATLIASGSLSVNITATLESRTDEECTRRIGYKAGTSVMGVGTENSLLSGFNATQGMTTSDYGQYLTSSFTYTPAIGQTYLCIGISGQCYSIIYKRCPGQIVRDIRIQCVDTSSGDTTAPTITAPTFSEWVADSRTVSYIANDDVGIDRITVNYGAVASTTTRNSATQLMNEFTASYANSYSITATDISGNERTYTGTYVDYKLDGYAPKISQALFVRSTDNSILVTNGLTPTIGGNWAGEATCYILVMDDQGLSSYVYSSGISTVTYDGTPCTLVTSSTILPLSNGSSSQTTSTTETIDGAIGRAWYKVEGITSNIDDAPIVLTDNLNKSSSYSITLSNISTTTDDFIYNGNIITKYVGTTSTIVIPSRVTSILVDAFSGATGTISFETGSTMTAIGTYAFAGFLGTSITLPSTITSIGASAFRECVNLINTTVPSSVTSLGTYAFYNCNSLESNLVIPDAITSIGNYTFYNCYKLTNVTIGSSVTSIGTYAFYDCNVLTSVSLPATVTNIGDYAFYRCYDLAILSLPSGLTNIGVYAFYGCSSIEGNIVIPDGVTNIKDYAFSGCFNIDNITLGDNVTRIGAYAFEACDFISINMPDSITYIGAGAFYSCQNLESITIPSGVTCIYEKTFLYNRSLTNIAIADTVTIIGDYAFDYCIGLVSVTIGNNVTSIGEGAFIYCRNLTGTIIPDSVATIGSYAFHECIKLTNINLSNNVTSIGVRAFSQCTSLLTINVDSSNTTYKSVDGVLYNYAETTLIAYPAGKTDTIFTIPSSVLIIGEGAFYYSKKLDEIIIPDNVTNIMESAFYESGLYLITISQSSNLTSIGKYAFAFTWLHNVALPNSLITIGENAFTDCLVLQTITIGSNVTTIGDEVFSFCQYLTSINVDLANTYYKSIDGVLYNYAGTTLISYPAQKAVTSFTIPDGVSTIKKYAFSFNYLTSIIVPDSVTVIEDSALNRSIGYLTSITFESITPAIIAYGAIEYSTPIYVPASSVDAYKAAWTEYTNWIYPIP